MSEWPNYRDMNQQQMLDWGIAERKVRLTDLEDRSAHGLRIAQEKAEARRKAICASRSAASSMVREASLASRSAS